MVEAHTFSPARIKTGTDAFESSDSEICSKIALEQERMKRFRGGRRATSCWGHAPAY